LKKKVDALELSSLQNTTLNQGSSYACNQKWKEQIADISTSQEKFLSKYLKLTIGIEKTDEKKIHNQ